MAERENPEIEPFTYTDPLFIAAVVAAILGDFIFLGGAVMGIGLLPLAGLGLVPLVMALVLRQVIGLCVLGFVFVKMRSPNGVDILGGWVNAILRPWIVMLIAWVAFFFPFSLTLGLFLAAFLQNRFINFLLQQAVVVGLAATGVGAEAAVAIEATEVAEVAEGAKMIEAGAELAERAESGARVAGRVEEAAENLPAGRKAIDTEKEYFGMPESNPVVEAEEQEVGGEPLVEDEFSRRRKAKEASESEDAKSREKKEESKDEEIEKRVNLGDVEKRKILESLENVPMGPDEEEEDEGDETLDLRKAV